MTTKKVLLVEDEQAHAELIRRAFNRDGSAYTLHVVGTLQQAREAIPQVQPDMMFIDYLLPDGDGLDLLADAQENFPVVVLTSQGNEQIAVNALKAGALDYVTKSVMVFADMPRIAERTLREWSHIQARRRMERKLRESEETFRTMLEMAAEGILLIEADGQVAMTNRYAQEALHLSREDILQRSAFDLLPIETGDLEQIKNHTRDGDHWLEMEARIVRRADGSVGQLAEAVEMERTHLYRKLRQLGIDPKRVQDEGA